MQICAVMMIGEYKMDKTQAAETNSRKSISSIENEIKELCAEFARSRNKECYPLFVRDTNIQSKLVDKLFGELREGNFSHRELDVIIDSGGGSMLRITLLFCFVFLEVKN